MKLISTRRVLKEVDRLRAELAQTENKKGYATVKTSYIILDLLVLIFGEREGIRLCNKYFNVTD